MIVSIKGKDVKLKDNEVLVAKNLINTQFNEFGRISQNKNINYQYFILLFIAQLMSQDEINKFDDDKLERIIKELEDPSENRKE